MIIFYYYNMMIIEDILSNLTQQIVTQYLNHCSELDVDSLNTTWL